LIFFTQSVSTTVFRLSVVLFSLFGLTIFSLSLSLASKLAGKTACIATVCMASPAPPADTKMKIAPSTLNQDKHRKACLRTCNKPEDVLGMK
jgi:hypothetical protein